MLLIFICGPYRNADPWKREQNVRRAEEAAHFVAIQGAMPVCPHANTRPYFEGVNDDAFWLAGTREMMRRCDGVLCVDGWRRSSGSVSEVDEALRLGMPVFDAEGRLFDASRAFGFDEHLDQWIAVKP
jgi:hypothetical protein